MSTLYISWRSELLLQKTSGQTKNSKSKKFWLENKKKAQSLSYKQIKIYLLVLSLKVPSEQRKASPPFNFQINCK